MPWKGLSDLRESVDHWPGHRILFILIEAFIGFPASRSCGERCWFVPKALMGTVGIWKAALSPSWCNLCSFVAVLVQGLCEDWSSKGGLSTLRSPGCVGVCLILSVSELGGHHTLSGILIHILILSPNLLLYSHMGINPIFWIYKEQSCSLFYRTVLLIFFKKRIKTCYFYSSKNDRTGNRQTWV